MLPLNIGIHHQDGGGNLNEIIQRTTPANASGVPMPQAVVADTKAAVCCRLVIVRPRSNQFFRFVLFHVADYIYCSCSYFHCSFDCCKLSDEDLIRRRC